MVRMVVLLLVYRHRTVSNTTTNAGILHTMYTSVTIKIVVAAWTCRRDDDTLVLRLARR